MTFPPPIGSFTIDFRGIDLIRSRDCILWSKGDIVTTTLDPALAAGGWAGGQGVRWIESDVNEPVMTYSDGRWCGFLLWGSDESADQYTAMTGQQAKYKYALMVFGGPVISTSTYETYTYASRIAGGPFVPLVYAPQDCLYLSLRGIWTKEDELTLSGSPLAPALPTGVVTQTPKPVNEFFLGIQVTM